MTCTRSFLFWLLHQTGRQDHIGDLARDVAQDIADFACGADGPPEDGPKIEWSWKDLYRHIRVRAARVVKLSLVRALKEWRENPVLAFRDPPSCPGVYCVSYVHAPHVAKIGRATNIRKRMQSLEVGAPGGVYLRAILSFNPKDESVIHERFDRLRISGGEWFYVRDELALEIEKCS